MTSKDSREEPVTNPQALLEDVSRLVERIGQDILIPNFKSISHERKSDGSPVTEIDREVQSILERELSALVASPVLGEEMGPQQQQNLWSDRHLGLWCVDPIDGTTNYINGIPYFAISVAYFASASPLVGVVYNPVSGELFAACAGEGATLCGERFSRSDQNIKMLGDCVASIDFKRLPSNMRQSLIERPPYSSQRNFGAASLEWCHVASGQFDVYLHGRQKIWDFAAGALVLAEAGGRMSTFDHEDIWVGPELSRTVMAASNAAIFADWIAHVDKIS